TVGHVSFGLVLGADIQLLPLSTSVAPYATQLPLFKYIVWVLPWPIYLAFVTFVTTASSNAVNLTDGLDGLAAGLTVIAAGAFAIFCYLFGRVDAARYLGVLHLPGAGELTIFCGALMGASLGFLWFNAHPAQVFMGDTGALAIGGALGTVAIIGLGKSGVAAARLLAREGVRVYASDASDHPYAGAAAEALKSVPWVDVEIGRHDLAKIRHAAGVVVSPGVPPDAPVLTAA